MEAQEPAPHDAVDIDDGDLALARRIAAGDRVAFEQLMRSHNPALFRTARSIVRDDADAEDVLQDAYIAALRHIGDFRGGSRLTTWLTRIVINSALGRLRSASPGQRRRAARCAWARFARGADHGRRPEHVAGAERDARTAARPSRAADRRAAARVSHRVHPARGRADDDRRGGRVPGDPGGDGSNPRAAPAPRPAPRWPSRWTSRRPTSFVSPARAATASSPACSTAFTSRTTVRAPCGREQRRPETGRALVASNRCMCKPRSTSMKTPIAAADRSPFPAGRERSGPVAERCADRVDRRHRDEVDIDVGSWPNRRAATRKSRRSASRWSPTTPASTSRPSPS